MFLCSTRRERMIFHWKSGTWHARAYDPRVGIVCDINPRFPRRRLVKARASLPQMNRLATFLTCELGLPVRMGVCATFQSRIISRSQSRPMPIELVTVPERMRAISINASAKYLTIYRIPPRSGTSERGVSRGWGCTLDRIGARTSIEMSCGQLSRLP